MNCLELKEKMLADLRATMSKELISISKANLSKNVAAKRVNKHITKAQNIIKQDLLTRPQTHQQLQSALLILKYVVAVVSLESRHQVWPYEYMTFSRRVGELWENFVSTAWDYNCKLGVVEDFTPPKFKDVLNSTLNLSESTNSELVVNLVQLIGEVNMVEDRTFMVDKIPHVVDFKSGFGSNEKGNMLRLIAVGRAYRLWNASTRLLFLVRQPTNNNYLRVIERAKLWEIYCGDAAYREIDRLTGANTIELRRDIIDFEKDLNQSFWNYLKQQPTDLTTYLLW